MSLYVYRRASSSGARNLAEALNAKRFRGDRTPITQSLKRGDAVVCWGEALPPIAGVRILNGGPIQSKYGNAVQLGLAGIPTIEVSRTKPVDGEWLPRINNHVGGNDLLLPPDNPDFWTKKFDFVKEFRVHSFLHRSLRAGIKAPREGEAAHPWIRSWDAGWGIKYDGVSSRQKHREIAHAAVETLGLQFGAVDIGEKADGSLVVLECNRAPGIEHGTLDAYTRAVRGWIGA